MPRSVKYVNRLIKLYGKAESLMKLTKLPIIKQLVRKSVKTDVLFYVTKDTVIPVNEEIEKPEDLILPSKIVDYFIEKANYIWRMNFCICRTGNDCKKYPKELGCIFMGEAVKRINPEFGKLVTKEEALEHIKKCREAGLVHTIGRSKFDTIWLDAWPGDKLLTACNCCECCCLTRFVPMMGSKVGEAAVKLPGIDIVVKEEKCTGCGECLGDICLFNSIELENGKAKIDESCRSCGRCIEICPEKAIKLEINNEQFIQQTIERVDKLVDIT